MTTFRIVPRGTEGAISLEGTFAGLLAASVLAFVGCLLGDVIISILSYSFRIARSLTRFLDQISIDVDADNCI